MSHNYSSDNNQNTSQDGWTLYYNEDGYPYYYNSITGESQWAETESYSNETQNEEVSHHPTHAPSNYFAYETQPNVNDGYIQDDIYEAPELSYSEASDESSDSELDERFQAYLASQQGKHEFADEYDRLEKHAAKTAKRQSDSYVRQHKKHDGTSVKQQIYFWESQKPLKKVTFEDPANVDDVSDIEENTDSTEVSSDDSDVQLMQMSVYPEWLTVQSIVSNAQYAITHPVASIEPYTLYLWNHVITSNNTDQGLKTWIYNSITATSAFIWGYVNQLAMYVVDGADAVTPIEPVRVEGVEEVSDDVT